MSSNPLLQSKGELRYSPQLLGEGSSKWWLVMDCDPEIGKYYRYLYSLDRFHSAIMVRPAWKEHITVIRNEEPPKPEAWHKYEGLVVEFGYRPEVLTNGEYYWLAIECPFLTELRQELGLGEPEFPFHLSIGHGKA